MSQLEQISRFPALNSARLLESLMGKSDNDPEFLAQEKKLAEEGAEARAKAMEAFHKKQERERKAAEKVKGAAGKRKGRAKRDASESPEMSEALSELSSIDDDEGERMQNGR